MLPRVASNIRSYVLDEFVSCDAAVARVVVCVTLECLDEEVGEQTETS